MTPPLVALLWALLGGVLSGLAAAAPSWDARAALDLLALAAGLVAWSQADRRRFWKARRFAQGGGGLEAAAFRDHDRPGYWVPDALFHALPPGWEPSPPFDIRIIPDPDSIPAQYEVKALGPSGEERGPGGDYAYEVRNWVLREEIRWISRLSGLPEATDKGEEEP